MSDKTTIRSEFYWEPTFRCSVHSDKPSGYVVKRQGEQYRQACTERCAIAQAAELERGLTTYERP